MKKYLLSLLTLGLLVSCGEINIINFNHEVYTSNLNYLVTTDPQVYDETELFNLNSYMYKNNDNYIYTVQIEYKEKVLTSLKCLMLPSTYLLQEDNYYIPNIGYSESLSLGPKNSNNEYKGYNLSFKTDSNEETFKIYVSYMINADIITRIYKINEFKRLGA